MTNARIASSSEASGALPNQIIRRTLAPTPRAQTPFTKSFAQLFENLTFVHVSHV